MKESIITIIAATLMVGCGPNIDIWNAANDGNIDAIKKHLAAGVDVNASDGNGVTPLHFAASESHGEVVKLLIAEGADVNASDENGATPLHMSAAKGHKEIAKLLIAEGTDLDWPSNDKSTPLRYAAVQGHGELVELLIAEGANVNATAKNGSTPLAAAASSGHIGVAELLIVKGADISLHEKNKASPLHLALHQGHNEVIKLLIANEVDAVSKCGSCGLSPLATAAANCDREVVKLLISKGADVNEKGEEGLTALHTAAENGNNDVAELLIEKGADITATYKYKWTSLHIAADNGHQEIAELLLTKGAPVNAKDRVGQTPLHKAADGKKELYDMLIANGANIKIFDVLGTTPEELRREYEYEETEFSTEDNDDDGFYDNEEELTGHDPNDPKDKPTQEEVDEAEAKRNKALAGNDAWEEHKATCEQEGWKYGLLDYAGNRPPDDENFFMAKPFSGYLYTQKNGEEAVCLNPKIKERFETVKAEMLTPQDDEENKPPADWATFAEKLRTRAKENSEYKSLIPAEGTDNEVLTAYFRQFDGVVDDLREAAKRPRHFYPAQYENGYTTLLPHLEIVKWFSQLLKQSASFKLHWDDSEGAMVDARLLFRLYTSLENGSAINRIIQIDTGTIIVNTFENGSKAEQWSETQLAEWSRFLDTDQIPFDAMELALQFDRVLSLYSLEGTANGLGEFMSGESLNESIPYLPKKFVEQELISLDTQMRQLIGVCRRARETGSIDHDQLAKLSDKTEKGIIGAMLFSGLNKCLKKDENLMNRFNTAADLLRQHGGK
ncbi:ankyrin repeat domain-containing protein [Verrucomicrobia bacterium]|nr:ankyrin repeat domain-containing protein [Verrucomicrobiota bacterium]